MSVDEGGKKKRGRKKIKKVEEPSVPKVHRKRGRKPIGGKIIQQHIGPSIDDNVTPNIILHLKCSLKDIKKTNIANLQYDPNVEQIEAYTMNEPKINDLNYCTYNENNMISNEIIDIKNDTDTDDSSNNNNNNMRQIWKKINSLKISLHKNDVADKRSACFWCTCDFDNPPIYIPKYEIKNSYQVYGCFCSPECAVSYLMNETIDSATKFERYHLINHIYGKIYEYENNIKPAPSPFYLLNKYYGNLTIKEYRKLLRHDCLLLVVDKPLTHILPELHEDNDDFILNSKIIPTNTYKLKRKAAKFCKKSIVNNTFGIKT